MLAPVAAAVVVSAAALAPAQAAVQPAGQLTDTVTNAVPVVTALVDATSTAVEPHAEVVGQLARTRPQPQPQSPLAEPLALTSLDGSALTGAARQLGLNETVPRCLFLAERSQLADLGAYRKTAGKTGAAQQCGTELAGLTGNQRRAAADPLADLLGGVPLVGSLSTPQVGPLGAPAKKPGKKKSTAQPGSLGDVSALLGGLPGVSGAVQPGAPSLVGPYLSIGQPPSGR
ncbi:hypothetical protein [Thermomonospora amylolytica]|uniref:hypothetical protein n=1 Tax=Thermomonospora amylolytica TaxID=1411117 RepID=UPI000E6C7730|nr:hypothetical protein [Thermomonospora amylolytica]